MLDEGVRGDQVKVVVNHFTDVSDSNSVERELITRSICNEIVSQSRTGRRKIMDSQNRLMYSFTRSISATRLKASSIVIPPTQKSL